MKKLFSTLSVLSVCLFSAQIYTPSGNTGSTLNSSPTNVGIGTQYPGGILDINANGNIPVIRGNGGYIPTGLRFIDDSYTQAGQIKEWAIWKGNAWSKGLGFMRYDAVNPCGTGICDIPLYLADNGKVGIGTSSPEARFHVLQTSNNQPIDAMTIDVESFGSTANAANSHYFRVRDIGASGHVPFIIKGNGNVGIGSEHPDAPLTVKGLIHAEEVKVDLQVPADYVFEKYYTGSSSLKPDYKMPSLQEIEKFTKENNHLPNIPSAKEIRDKGLSLGEMSNLLLQKIEELTLYTIEQNKLILEQQKRIEALEKKNK
ncbi:hypothetical protein M2347_001594 [Chryseobacterium sp. H1D6B]|uniref:hypothetical protein n=1 Tax=Chryseobacterium sp. H1D6B TaxID=2940588 RepID=UPI0015CBBA97|nr:hypothetical protein [Chryseobacterium sp. H1D6B]MDH6251867.1 hypothetical protein [Chryseobacterium sp. H1D6B]